MRATILQSGPSVRRWILLALVVLFPILVWRGANDQVNVPKLGVLMLGVALVAGVRVVELMQGGPVSSLRRLLVPAAAIVVPLAIGWVFSPFRSYALFGFYSRWQGLIPYAVIALFGILLADAFGGRARQIAWALVTSAALVGAYALIQRFGLDPLDWVRPGGDPNEAVTTLGNPNFTGGFLGIIVPIAFGLSLTETERRPWAIVLSLLVMAGLIVSFSQGGWGAALAGSAIVGGFWFLPRWRQSLKVASAIVALVAALAIGLVLMSAIGVGRSLVPGTAYIRGEAWSAAAAMTMEHPLVGRGPNAFAIEGVQFRSESNGTRAGYNFPDDPHSVLLSLTASAGILGGLGFLVFLWWILSQARGLQDPPLLAVAFFGAVVAYVIQSLVSIDEVALRATLWTSLAGFVSATATRDPDPVAGMSKKERARARTEGLRQPLGAALAVLLSLAAVWWSANLVIADTRVWQGRLLAASGAVGEARAEFATARGFRDDFEYRVVEGSSLAHAALASETPDQQSYTRALQRFDFLDDFPHVLYLLQKAESLDLGTPFSPSFDADALEVYERMTAIDPLNPMIQAGAAEILIELGRAGEAIDRLEPWADKVDPIRRPYLFAVLALAYAADEDATAARETLDLLDDEGASLPHAQRALELVEGGS